MYRPAIIAISPTKFMAVGTIPVAIADKVWGTREEAENALKEALEALRQRCHKPS